MDKVRFGFFEKFKGDNTLLFFGSGPTLRALNDVLSTLRDKEQITLSRDERFLALRGEDVVISLTHEPRGGMCYIEQGKPVFKWTIAKKGMPDMLEKISNVLAGATRCHNYLDGDLDEVQVMVAKDEYRLLDNGVLMMEKPLKWEDVKKK